MSSAVSVRGRFRRSVHLAHDLHDPRALEGYVVTAKGRELVARVVRALSEPGGPRAWAMAGPYGGGKSALALFLARLLRGDADARALLEASEAPLADALRQSGGAFHPVAVGGAREPLADALARGLDEALGRLGVSVEGGEDRSDRAVLARYLEAARRVREATGGGLFLVVDEMGKLLEHAALYPERSDLFLLQQLAEHATRAEAEAPLLVLTVLHQAFDRYAGRLPEAQRDEWRKVQGRFEDVAHVEPVEETLRLLAASVERDPATLPEGAAEAVDGVLEAATLPAHLDPEGMRGALRAALPLHPAVALLVGPLFRRLAQSERSLFAFLASGEPHSFLDVVAEAPGQLSLFSEVPPPHWREASASGTPPRGAVGTNLPEPSPAAPPDPSPRGGGPKGRRGSYPHWREASASGAPEAGPLGLYRLDHLYDYLTGALGATLYHGGAGRLWAEAESALGRLPDPSALQVRMLKQVALLDFCGDLAGLPPAGALLRATADAPAEAVDGALDALREARALGYRPFAGTFHVWHGSDFRLDEHLAAAREALPPRVPLAALLAEAAPPVPTLARRHSYRTGTDRTFAVAYASETSWREPSASSDADGRIVYVLPETSADPEAMLAALRGAEAGPLTLFALPEGADRLRDAARDLAALDHVRRHAPALAGDAAARIEVDRQRGDLAAHLHAELARLLSGEALWVHQGEAFRLQGERALQERLSALCDAAFPHAPEVRNELVNRRSPSSSAVRALKLLLAAMLERPEEERLGIEGTPAEYGLYATLLEATGMHRRREGAWGFAPPAEGLPGCRAVWDALDALAEEASGRRLPLSEVYEHLTAPPFGLREAVIPVFVLAWAGHARRETAWYEAGTFVPEPGLAEVERLLRSPDKFEVQRVRLDGARGEVLSALAPLVGLAPDAADPLAVVLRLLRAVRPLPPYTRRTARLAPDALAVREALHRATEPLALLFEALPEAVGLPSLLEGEPDPEAGALLADRLRQSLRALGSAYDALLAEVSEALARAFGVPAEAEALRPALAERAARLLPHATEPALKAFLIRASDAGLEPQAWLESLAALLARKPPAQWLDADRPAFDAALRETARRFRTLEPLVFDAEAPSGDGAPAERLRVGVTALGGPEREAVVTLAPEDTEAARAAEARLRAALDAETASPEARLAALAHLLSDLLAEREGTAEGGRGITGSEAS